MATGTAFDIGQDWVDINTMSGIPVGTELKLQNKGLPQDIIQGLTSIEKPSDDETNGVYMKQISPFYRVTAGERRLWVRLYRYDRPPSHVMTAPLHVQVI